MTSLCEFLEWDTAFFGRRIARATLHRLDESTAAAVKAWCIENRIECLYFLADADDPATAHIAESTGMHLQDIRVTFEYKLDENAPIPDTTVRLARADDHPELIETARQSYGVSRYYADPCFTDAQSDALYKTWMQKSLNGYADAVLVADLDGAAAGFVTCHLNTETQIGSIGLVGVAPEARGHGIGLKVVNGSLHWFRDKNMNKVTVVTQGRNIAAQRLYQRAGFVTQAVQLWYHFWLSGCE